ncbi:MAG: dTDP-4-amino-4,6-dideoxygalactose transaminase [Bacteroidia bacterium]|nr:dTDP-4-amino-4,6-dideoxygalactose transaminase [Bacteroidia bacterium]
MIPFNKPYLSGNELEYIKESVMSGKISGDGVFTKKCHRFFEEKYSFPKVLLTTSCTDALELSALLLEIKPGDEVIMPSYTFVSTANAFALRGATIRFIDSNPDNPNMDVSQIEPLINENTKVIVVMHYAGIACEMDTVMALADKYNLYVVEDAAQAIDSFYKGKPLGGIGHLGAFSFHETKNIISGEGGLITVNDSRFSLRSEIIREKGTNRSAFFRGEVDKYGWVEAGSSFLPSDIIAAFLAAQLENLDAIQQRRKSIWQQYWDGLSRLQEAGKIRLPHIPDYATNNAHMFYIICTNLEERTGLIQHLKQNNIHAVFHYLSLHSSPYFQEKHDGRPLPLTDYYTDTLLRLPLYYELTDEQVQYIIHHILQYFE